MSVMVIRSRMPKSKYFHYRLPGSSVDTCKILYVGCEDSFSDFSETLKSIPGIDNTLACLMFESDTEVNQLVNELEMFIKNCKYDDIKVVLDIFSLYKHLGLVECQNILCVLHEYLLCNWNIRFAFAPPLLTPSESTQWEEVSKIQEFVNQQNVNEGKNPLFPFRWVMRFNKNNLLYHVPSNWEEDGVTLNLKGSKAYFRCIWMYIRDSMDASLVKYDLNSRIKPQTPSSFRSVNTQSRRSVGVGRRFSSVSCGNHDARAVLSHRRVNSVPHGNHDARLVISHRRITRELELCKRLMSMNIVGYNTRGGVEEMLKNMSLYFTVNN